MKEKAGILLFVLFISIPVILPFFHAGYFPTHDGEWAVVRLSEMFRELKDFQFPPRFSGYLNFGYGYPLFNFAYPLPYHLGMLFVLLKFGFVGSIKALFALSVPLSALFMYVTSRKLFGSITAGMISAVLYVYLPYRFVDLFVRGSLGESLSFVLFPLIFYCALKIRQNVRSYFFIAIASFAYGALILTHNIMAVLFTPVLIIFLGSLVIPGHKRSVKPFLLFICAGIGLSAFFWIPALFEKNLIVLSKVPIADRNLYFVDFHQLITATWGYGVPTDKDGFSYQIGWPHNIAFFLVTGLLIFLWFRKLKIQQPYINSISVLSISVFVMTFFLFEASSWLWKTIPLLSEINYPWTLLSQIGFVASLLAGYLAVKGNIFKFTGLILALCAIIFFLPYVRPQAYFDKGDDFYLTNEATTTSSDELMPLWVKDKPTERFLEKVEIVEGAGEVENVSYNSKKISFDVLAEEDSTVRINTIYYPGWNANLCHPEASAEGSHEILRFTQNDNKCARDLVIDYQNNKGVMELEIPKGENKVELKFSETPLRLFADLLSFASVLFLLFHKQVLKKLHFKIVD